MLKIKLLFDQNISYRILGQLSEIFSESCQVRMAGLENESDLSIWQYAKDKGFTIVTFDADFYDITLLRGCPP
jgi:predicted nuclease of predicted toxin-antitoxin system